MDNILELKNVSYYYQNGNKKINILKNTDYVFERGKFYTVLGPSGSGKTTMLALASALDAPKGGNILYDGMDIEKIGLAKYRRSKISIVFQNFNLINYMTAFQNVIASIEISGIKLKNKKEAAYEILSRVGLTKDEAHRSVLKISGGQQQRVAIARAISTGAEIIFADEPTGNLDGETSKEIIEIFKDLAHNQNKCIIAVTHSREVAKESDVVLELSGGSLHERTFNN